MGISCITIHATMLASLVGIHAIFHCKVRAFNLVDYFLRMIFKKFCLCRNLKLFIQTLEMLGYIFIGEKRITGFDLRASAFDGFHRVEISTTKTKPFETESLSIQFQNLINVLSVI